MFNKILLPLFTFCMFTNTSVAEEFVSSLIDIKGNEVGTIHVLKAEEGLLLKVDARDLTPGEHGMHLHAIGICDPATGFKSSGGHISEVGKKHGLLNKEGPHEGDLPNLIVAETGVVKVELSVPWIDIKGSDEALFDKDGSALVIHALPDDHKSQPIGGSGDRVACAAFTTTSK